MFQSEEVKDKMYPSGNPEPEELANKAAKAIAVNHASAVQEHKRFVEEQIKTLQLDRRNETIRNTIGVVMTLVCILLLIISFLSYRRDGK